MKYNRIMCLFMVCVMCLLGAACTSRKGNTLLEGAAPQNSALTLYYYDGADTVRGHLFDTAEVQTVLDSLAEVNAKPVADWSPEDLNAPLYGVTIMKEDGRPLSAVWSEGLWITQEGDAYRFEYDFDKLWTGHEWQATDTWSGKMVTPCTHALTYVDGVWDATWMTPAQELTAPEKVEIQLLEWNDTSVRVNLINHSGQEWTFGEYYHLEVQLDGVWYQVPTAPGENWVVHDIAYILPDSEDMEMTYSLVCYGELPAGHYRLVAEAFEEGLAVEQDIVK